MPAPANSPHYVYRLYDTGGELLYIGCTENVDNRLYQHRNLGSRSVLFAHRIARVESVEYPTRAEALAAERAAIEDEYPAFNVIYRRPTPLTKEERELIYALASWTPPPMAPEWDGYSEAQYRWLRWR